MAGLSDIEWTDATWNPVSGCTILSPGCTHCYAMRMAARLQAMGHPAYENVTRKVNGKPVWTGTLHLNEQALMTPLRWRAPRKIFVNSMSDLFQDGIPAEFIERIWNVMAQTPQHIFQILTKRPENMLRVITANRLTLLPNIWLGTSVESRKYVGRIDDLQSVPAHVRFISYEPLLAPIGRVDMTGIHWAIVGGESGPRARSMKASWVDEIRTQCEEQSVAFFFKQWGGTNKKASGRSYLGRTWDNYPELRSVG
ncbi:MAG TPA: phage Gp37/Gp68 family protein [Rhizomicrobium sp.]|nr:phage Gp37/Gp68 family protein [Rhizomicrobium sp.]